MKPALFGDSRSVDQCFDRHVDSYHYQHLLGLSIPETLNSHLMPIQTIHDMWFHMLLNFAFVNHCLCFTLYKPIVAYSKNHCKISPGFRVCSIHFKRTAEEIGIKATVVSALTFHGMILCSNMAINWIREEKELPHCRF